MKKAVSKILRSNGINILACLRIILGLVFVISGGEKLIGPYQNFLYVVQSYALFPEGLAFLEAGAAGIVPWVEFLTGVFLVLGLWLKKTLYVFFSLLVCFIVIVGQAMIRGLGVEECGCFGGLFSLPLWGVLFFDSSLLILTAVCLAGLKRTAWLSLDNYFTRDG